MNCFWGPQEFFSKLPGVIKTTVGYSGGTKENPTYTDLGDHTETLQIEFDPQVVSYEDLLGHFFKEHDPVREQKTQYQSIIFYHDDKQREAAEKALKAFEEESGQRVQTQIREASTFYPAENYHQDYLKKAKGEVMD